MFAVSLGDPTSGNSRGSQRTPAIMVGSQPDGIATVSAGLLRYKGVQFSILRQAPVVEKVDNTICKINLYPFNN